MKKIERDVLNHKNIENVIRFYLIYLPPRGCESILDIGSGINMPYKGVLQTRCINYKSLDIRQNTNPKKQIDYICDLTQGTQFKNKKFHWGWCAETLEHIPPKLKTKVFEEILRICKNVVFTFPTPKHPTFYDDIGHTEVKINPLNYIKKFNFTDKSTKTGRNIWIFTDKKIKTEITKKGILQENCCEDNLPFKIINYKMISK